MTSPLAFLPKPLRAWLHNKSDTDKIKGISFMEYWREPQGAMEFCEHHKVCWDGETGDSPDEIIGVW